MAKILISINPFKKMDSLYTPQTLQQYEIRDSIDLPPHIYAFGKIKSSIPIGIRFHLFQKLINSITL